MNHDEAHQALHARIRELREARDALPEGSAERSAATEAIAGLRRQIDRIDTDAADALTARMDAAVADLEAVLGAHELDAASAIGRAIQALRDRVGLG